MNFWVRTPPRWGGGLPRERVGAQKFGGMPLKPRENKLFVEISRKLFGTPRKFWGGAQELGNKKLVFNVGPQWRKLV